MKNLYLVETVSFFRHRYVVEAEDISHAEDEVVWRLSDTDFSEFSQKHIDECISSSRQIDEKEYFDLFDKDNDYLNSWDLEQKKRFINKIDYR